MEFNDSVLLVKSYVLLICNYDERPRCGPDPAARSRTCYASSLAGMCQDVSGRVRMLEFQSSAQLAVIRAVVSSAPRGAARGISIFCIASILIWHVQCAASYFLPEITETYFNSGFLYNQSPINWLALVSGTVFGHFKGKTLHHPMHVDVTCRSQGKTCCTSGTLAALCVSWCNRMHLIRQYPTHLAMAVYMIQFVTSFPVPAYILRGF